MTSVVRGWGSTIHSNTAGIYSVCVEKKEMKMIMKEIEKTNKHKILNFCTGWVYKLPLYRYRCIHICTLPGRLYKDMTACLSTQLETCALCQGACDNHNPRRIFFLMAHFWPKKQTEDWGVTGVEQFFYFFLRFFFLPVVLLVGEEWARSVDSCLFFSFSPSWLLFSSRVSIIQFICLEERLWMLEQVHGLD